MGPTLTLGAEDWVGLDEGDIDTDGATLRVGEKLGPELGNPVGTVLGLIENEGERLNDGDKDGLVLMEGLSLTVGALLGEAPVGT